MRSGIGDSAIDPVFFRQVDSAGREASGNPTDDSIKPIPTPSTNGAALTRPSGATGVIFYLSSGDSLTYTIATAQPTSAPADTVTVDGNAYKQWSEPLGPGTNIYVTAKTGTPRYRFV